MPGDTHNITTSAVVRLQTPLTPIMDNIYMDTYYFYCPLRILWDHAREFFGENKDGPWIPTTQYSIPTISPPSGGWNVGTIADYLGIPVGKQPIYTRGISALPFRAYALICDEWFRDQNLTDPLVIPKGDTGVTGVNTGNYITDTAKGGLPFKVAKFHDYFTSSLPYPQRSPDIGLFGNLQPYGINPNSFNSYVPVVPLDTTHVSEYGIHFHNDTSSVFPNGASLYVSSTQSNPIYAASNITPSSPNALRVDNLWANVGQMELTINQLRLAFQLQKFYEKNARAGTRYREILKEHFGITSSDGRMQIPEYLGGHRFPLSIHQVANQTSQSGEYLGDLGAMSNTSDVHEDFIKSFEEHGFIIGVACVRYDHSYPQGLERFWRRSTKTDFYWPVFANIGEQPVYDTEIYMYDQNDYPTFNGEEVFGYQEAWADYRYKPSRISGEMRPGIANSLASWHLSDYYNGLPQLSDSWIREDKSNVDRVLSVQSSVANQVFCDFYVQNIATRPMPVYSVPGLIDHH